MSPENPVSESRKHYIQVIVENRFGVLSRVAGLFSARGFNIDSLSVAPGLDTSVSQMTIETQGDDHVVELSSGDQIPPSMLGVSGYF